MNNIIIIIIIMNNNDEDDDGDLETIGNKQNKRIYSLCDIIISFMCSFSQNV